MAKCRNVTRNLKQRSRCGGGNILCHNSEMLILSHKTYNSNFRYFLKIPKEKWPVTFIDALNICDLALYPSIHSFERSFSSLRRLKTYLRNKTGENRLNGLALLNVHRDIEVPYEDILKMMARTNRRMVL